MLSAESVSQFSLQFFCSDLEVDTFLKKKIIIPFSFRFHCPDGDVPAMCDCAVTMTVKKRETVVCVQNVYTCKDGTVLTLFINTVKEGKVEGFRVPLAHQTKAIK